MGLSEYYKVLDVTENASLTEIKQAYRKNAKLLHPDVSSDPNSHEKFILLNEAYEYLQNVKTGKVYNSKKYKYSNPKDNQKYYEDWKAFEREKARERARRHAKMKYDAFTKTDFYETAIAISILLEFFTFLFALFIAIGVPIIGYLKKDDSGLIGAAIVFFVTIPFWFKILITKRPKFEIKELMSSFYRLFKSKLFQIVLVTILNLYLIIYYGFNTLITIWYLPIILTLVIAIGYIFSIKAKKKTTKFIIILGAAPGIVNLFFMINFYFSSNKIIETYSFKHVLQPTEHGMQKSSQIRLEQDKYEDYLGIRIFVDFESMEVANSITYHIEDGLFGLRVIKSYKFN